MQNVKNIISDQIGNNKLNIDCISTKDGSETYCFFVNGKGITTTDDYRTAIKISFALQKTLAIVK